jgi:hypothetical protein
MTPTTFGTAGPTGRRPVVDDHPILLIEFARAVVMVTLAVLAITAVLPAILHLASLPFR